VVFTPGDVTTSTSNASAPAVERLARELRLRDGLAIAAGTIVGSGIFLVPNVIAQQVPSLFVVLLVWVVGALLALAGSFILAELGSMFPAAGGIYVYLREIFGPAVAFVYGWAGFVAIETGGLASLAAAFSIYLGQIVSLSPAGTKMASVCLLLVLTFLNILGIRLGKYIQNLFSVCKFGGIGAMCIMLLANPNWEQLKESFWAGSAQTSPSAFGVALLAAMWAYFGWHNVSYSAGEFRNPRRDLPSALLIGTVVVAVTYITANVAYYSVLSSQQVASADRVAAVALAAVLGQKGASLLAVLIIISVIGASNGLLMTSSRLPFAMAADRLLPPMVALTHSRTKTPILSITLQGIWAIVLVMVGSFNSLITYVVFTACFFFVLIALGLVKLRRSRPDMARPFRSPLYPFLPIGFALANLVIILNTFVTNPKGAAVGTALVLLGMPLYFVFASRPKGQT
jgi:basic amino acid/polyamine antiporter, APA family